MSVHLPPQKAVSIVTEIIADGKPIPQSNETLSEVAFEFARKLDTSDPEKVPFYKETYKSFKKYTPVRDYHNFRWLKDCSDSLPIVGRYFANASEQTTDKVGYWIATNLGAPSILFTLFLCLAGYGLTKSITRLAGENSAFSLFVQSMAETVSMGQSTPTTVTGVLILIAIALSCVKQFGLYLTTVAFGIHTERSIRLEAETLVRYESLAGVSGHNAWLFEYYAMQLRESAASRGPSFSRAGLDFLINSSLNKLSYDDIINALTKINQNDLAFVQRIEKILVNNYRMPASAASEAALGITIETGAYTGLILSLLKSHNISSEWQERYGFNPRYCYVK